MSEQWLDHVPPMQLKDICTAYESGFGHGYAGDGLANPYGAGTPSGQAYDIGVEAGKRQSRIEKAMVK